MWGPCSRISVSNAASSLAFRRSTSSASAETADLGPPEEDGSVEGGGATHRGDMGTLPASTSGDQAPPRRRGGRPSSLPSVLREAAYPPEIDDPASSSRANGPFRDL